MVIIAYDDISMVYECVREDTDNQNVWDVCYKIFYDFDGLCRNKRDKKIAMDALIHCKINEIVREKFILSTTADHICNISKLIMQQLVVFSKKPPIHRSRPSVRRSPRFCVRRSPRLCFKTPRRSDRIRDRIRKQAFKTKSY